LHFLILWFLAIGGPSTIFPDIHRYVVDVHHLLTNAEFAEIYTLAQVAPGPNAMYVTMIGWHLAGMVGCSRNHYPPPDSRHHSHLARWALERALSQRPDRLRHSPRPHADYDRTCVRELDDPDAHSEPRLARLLDYLGHRRGGPAQVVEPAVAVRRRRVCRYPSFV